LDLTFKAFYRLNELIFSGQYNKSIVTETFLAKKNPCNGGLLQKLVTSGL